MLQEESSKLAFANAEPFGERIHTLPSPSSAPSSMNARARETVLEVPRHEAISGAVSGRQRRQGRYPASWAAAADA